MKNTFLGLIAIGLFAANAAATTYTETNTYDIQVKQGSPFTGEFDLGPLTEKLYGATATFEFTDSDYNTETLTISGLAPTSLTLGSFMGSKSVSGDLGASALSDLRAAEKYFSALPHLATPISKGQFFQPTAESLFLTAAAQ